MIIGITLVVVAIAAAITVICVVVGKICSPESKGERGEKIVARILGKTISGKQYVINDLLFCNETGQTCQIDHIFINKFGIWVVETKNYAGYIYGTENQLEWTQVLAYGKEKNKFYNPIKQNATHMYHLSQYLNANNIFQSVVVFLSRADISHVKSNHVYSVRKLASIKTKSTDVRLSVEKMEYYYDRLLELKNNTSISREEHVKNIHKMQTHIQQGICPRCGGNLVLRNGGNGQFYGCSNYPKCRFTKKY